MIYYLYKDINDEFFFFSYTFQTEAETYVSASIILWSFSMSEAISLYIHIPFCKSKCPYCDFYSTKANESDYDKYTSVLIDKINFWSKKTDKEVSTVYFGGGTPSVLGADRLCSVLSEIINQFSICKTAEITVEVNPDTGKILDFVKLYKCGFNRISIGLQSAVEKEIKTLGRIHSPEDARHTVNRARAAGFKNISLDLMMGIPYQTKESLKNSIDFCNNCGVTHISSYILKIEEKTKFYQIKDSLVLPDDDEQAELYLFAVDYLNTLGYKQYEISNFAKTGFESRHNCNYWKCSEYIGIGPSAHSFYEGKRFYYGRNSEEFTENKIIYDGTGGNEEEFVMLSLRMRNGLCFNEFKKRYNKSLPCALISKSELYAKNGYMEVYPDRIAFTPKGFLVSNTIISDLLNYI